MPSLPPPHPSLPLPPQPPVPSSGQAYPSYYNSHYLQAYSGPSCAPGYSNAYIQHPTVAVNAPPISHSNNSASRLVWYEPGNHRCSHPGCTFTGSKKTVETHMMDRHLIYPPGWDKQKKKSDWDADPSLKGKPIPIQGTNVVLDSPEVVEAWIAERKRRFPTSALVEDKKRKLEEAVARGQIDITENHRPNKRRNVDHSDTSTRDHRRNNQRSNNYQRDRSGRGEQSQRTCDSGWPKKTQNASQIPQVKKVATIPAAQPESESSVSEDDDGEPETVSSKIEPQTPQPESIKHVTEQHFDTENHSGPLARVGSGKNLFHKKVPLQPKLPPRNPFNSRPTLLRNLLLPEIRVTISNLSQAIHFLVENDFLRDVELKPGQGAESNRIQVVGSEKDTKNAD